jgi:acyl carrier protein phosphodiesterase
MNYLAHIYLSGNNNDLLIGNFIADGVKGKKFQNYRPEVAKGILLHRFIDNYTDHHPIVKESKRRVREDFGKFSGIIIDVFYDHFLAKNWPKFSVIQLEIYINEKYSILSNHQNIFPEKVQYMFSKMIEQNWLLNYREVEGINRTLKGLSVRFPFPNKMNLATTKLLEDYIFFENDFLQFFPQLVSDVSKFSESIST